MNINAFLESLAENASRNFKIDQLSANRDNETLREVVRLALDPFTQFYIRKIPAYKFVGEDSEHQTSLEMAIQNLSYLSSREVTGNAAIAHLSAILSGLPADDAKVIERIIQKDLKCGVQVSTANTVWENLVAEYPCMLCSPFEQKLVDKIKFPAYVQLKMDGMRFNAIVRDGKCEYRSRNGKEIQLLGNLEEEFIKMADGIDCVFDGELLVVKDGQILDRQTGNGILNKANKGTISEDEAALVQATVWDVIPYVLFESSYCGTPYSKRIESLSLLIQKHNPSKIKLVQTDLVESLDIAQSIFETYLADGQEGIILKGADGAWENKRSKTQIKFKGELECDLKIVGTEEGTGKYAGMLGAIICESSDGVVKTRVGSGFSDKQRKELTPEDLIGRIAAVKYNMRSVDKQGNHSLFLPIILEIRTDKDVADPASLIK
jgi:hypothetical protein